MENDIEQQKQDQELGQTMLSTISGILFFAAIVYFGSIVCMLGYDLVTRADVRVGFFAFHLVANIVVVFVAGGFASAGDPTTRVFIAQEPEVDLPIAGRNVVPKTEIN